MRDKNGRQNEEVDDVDNFVFEAFAQPGHAAMPFLPKHLLAVHVANELLVVVLHGKTKSGVPDDTFKQKLLRLAQNL